MSRISAEECFTLDMEWYGVDRQGNIAVFCSAGEGNLPEFVCENAERADKLTEYFNGIGKNSDSVLLFSKTVQAERVAMNFSDKGLYYYDADGGAEIGISTLNRYYTRQSYPEKPLKYADLPKHIKEALKHNFMETEDFSLEDKIYVKHAYE